MDSKIKIIFFGTPEIAVSTLQALIESEEFDVCAVVCQPDRKVGRKQVLTAPPVKEAATLHGIPVFQPEKLSADDDLLATIKDFAADYFIVFAYGQLFDTKWLTLPLKRCVNVHVSLLPKYRGASPMQEALLHGDMQTGITIQEMVLKMDRGDILSAEVIDLGPHDTIVELHDKVTTRAPELVIETLKNDLNGLIDPLPQNEESASYCSKISKSDGFVDFNTMPTSTIYNKYRAYKAWPGVYTYVKDGTFSDSGTRVKLIDMTTSDSGIVLLEVQVEGKTPISFEDFKRNYLS